MDLFGMDDSVPVKFCPRCKVTKPVSEFSKTKRTKSGLQSYCKACFHAMYKKRHKRKRLISGVSECGTQKFCPHCKTFKPFSEFRKAKRPSATGLRPYCIACDHVRYKEQLAEYLKDPEPYRRRTRDSRLKFSYGISLADYEAMLAEQGGVCAICKQPETSISNKNNKVRYLSVDHEHREAQRVTADQVRGLLCNNCNSALGRFLDNPAIIATSILYLCKYGKDTIQAISILESALAELRAMQNANSLTPSLVSDSPPPSASPSAPASPSPSPPQNTPPAPACHR